MLKSKIFNCSKLKDKEIFVKYFEHLGYSIDKDVLKKYKYFEN